MQRREDELRLGDRQLSLGHQARPEPRGGHRVAALIGYGQHEQDPERVAQQDRAGELVGGGDDEVRVAGTDGAVKAHEC